MPASKQTWRVLGVVAIAVPMLMYGSLNYDQSAVGQPVAKVGEFALSEAELDYYAEQELRRISESSNIDLAELTEESGELIRAQVREQFVQRFLVADAIHRIGLRPQNAEVAEAVRADPRFSVDGAYSPQRFSALISDPQFFFDQTRENLAVTKIEGVFQQAALGASGLAEQLAAFRGEKRFVRKVTVPVDLSEAALQDVEVTYEQAEAFYAANRGDYAVPQRAKFEYALMRPADYLEQVQVDAGRLQAEHERRTTAARAAEELQLSLIDVPTEQQARQLLDELAAGADFAELAREHSQDLGSRAAGGDLGFLTRADLEPDMAEEVFATQPEAVAGPFAAGDSWQLFKVTGKIGLRTEDFEQVKEQLLREVRASEAEALAADVADRLSALIDDGEALAAAAAELELQVQSTDWLSPAAPLDELPEPFTSEQVLSEAFTAQLVEDPDHAELIALDDGGYLALRVIEHEPTRVKPLEEVAGEVRTRAQRAAEIRRIGGALSAQLRELAGEDSEEAQPAAENLELALDFADAPLLEVSRLDRPAEGVTAADVAALFSAQNVIGSTLPAYVVNYTAGEQQYAVFRIEKIEPAAEAVEELLVRVINDSLGEIDAAVLLNGFVSELRAQGGHVVAEAALADDGY